MIKKYKSIHLSHLQELTKSIIQDNPNWFNWSIPYSTFLLSGDMGAGKTTFIRNLLQSLGVKETINSPTFSLMNQYNLSAEKSIYHFDLYRIHQASELEDLEFEEVWGKLGICFVEWWQKVGDIFPYPRIYINIEIDSFETRTISFEFVSK
ncbi:tRNA (adenosine(37)-N6)-threonylcarbamoyltransferase complex ATPase subunit type 1 TsaE [Leptospira sp. GIMC2001]|uniref:tRNA (adenosine(37)-N6)-threonylcarbamoyltransferase complex ATPase subunit type 1 TsaE n=1 Tax=Leptospira sp. GIMC2001 TaxID=1513297 RepID=UPI00234B8D1F|nr:tRNA (adenosine(37)-N6)-threonylcarbamoyltransferase complex ATPase subunit type 1 TsaE [Leptospira sp. GIMC2001]WCL49550.1 tRNA (adenosine(37)-N6)-threonylcarbamoyltransferase complex ATPase subunit type 1 TsaE [Leptospira sp. GIMC2001]